MLLSRFVFSIHKDFLQLNIMTTQFFKKWTKDLKRHFPQEDKRNKHMKRCSSGKYK